MTQQDVKTSALKHGVILANTGSPSAPTPEAVRAYLNEFLRDPHICPMPKPLWSAILNFCILPSRSVRSAHKYEHIWTKNGSPLSAGMASLRNALQEALGDSYCVRIAMSYGAPSMKEAVKALADAGCVDVTAISLYPQSAYSTTKVVSDKLAEALRASEHHFNVEFVSSYYDRDQYIDALSESIAKAGFDASSDQLLMAFHAVPMRDINSGDTYRDEVIITHEHLARRLDIDPKDIKLGFQCRFDKSRKWLSPTTVEVLKDIDRERRLFVIAPNFAVDCLETLYDIDELLRSQYCADSHAKGEMIYVRCLNDSAAHVELLKEIVLENVPAS